MSQKIKHSKIKNTGLLFEILTRQVTADILNNKESKDCTSSTSTHICKLMVEEVIYELWYNF